MDESTLYQLLEGMETISALITSMEGEDDPQRLLIPLKEVAKAVNGIDGLAEQLIEQIEVAV